MVEEEGLLLVFRVFFRRQESDLLAVVAKADTGVVAFVFADAVPGEFVRCQAQNPCRPTTIFFGLVGNDDGGVAGKFVRFHAFQVKTILACELPNQQPVRVFVQAFLQAVGQG